ncbi:YtxH domain-containing protein [Porphyromonas circumdentaria]|uniref:YtxH-like protein n=1 Tax=Porphyromonas circumdentaria TaxID=29524 RepID=A0A1T4P1Z5_9PORP|nr:YtxH domain-containing protein [Porphyromonas circumdentaria]MBB6276278.1 gas vesicle protein [Porphyromonas circumdentaria]MDO4722250.1 YtxH domain-containing protein [Porphyromonas circumdentaria]SJZ85479.1 YtxH-like protein [Porphyromonas circumdentaria]
MKGGFKFGLGVALGAAIGAAIAYFADKEKRDSFVDSVSSAADKARDSIVEGYYDAKEKYYKYRDKLKKESSQILKDVNERVNEGIENFD